MYALSARLLRHYSCQVCLRDLDYQSLTSSLSTYVHLILALRTVPRVVTPFARPSG